MADLAGDIDVGEEVHFDFYQTVAAACLAPAALGIERESARTVAARSGVLRGGEQIADVAEQTRIRRGVRAGASADRALVDADDLVQMLQTLDAIELSGARARAVQARGELFIENFVDQARFAGAGHTSHAEKCAERERNVQMLQVIFRCTKDFERFPVSLAPLSRHRNFFCAREILPRDRARLGDDIVKRACRDNLAAVDARAGTDVDDEVRRAHGILVMLDDQHGVSQIAQMAKRIEQLVVVALVKPDRRLVEDIKNAHQAGADLGRQPDSLALAAGQGPCRARERQVR